MQSVDLSRAQCNRLTAIDFWEQKVKVPGQSLERGTTPPTKLPLILRFAVLRWAVGATRRDPSSTDEATRARPTERYAPASLLRDIALRATPTEEIWRAEKRGAQFDIKLTFWRTGFTCVEQIPGSACRSHAAPV
eukprot:2656659-Rhodomonas_salina.2